jgi:4-aminobutyrate aminotransferase-like enzyme
MKRAYEIFLEDVNGKRYIDFSAGGVTAVGYSHPKVGGGNRASKKRIRSM